MWMRVGCTETVGRISVRCAGLVIGAVFARACASSPRSTLVSDPDLRGRHLEDEGRRTIPEQLRRGHLIKVAKSSKGMCQISAPRLAYVSQCLEGGAPFPA